MEGTAQQQQVAIVVGWHIIGLWKNSIWDQIVVVVAVVVGPVGKEVVVVSDINEDELDDIYGEYDYVDAPVEQDEEPTWLGVDSSDDSMLADVLISTFNAK